MIAFREVLEESGLDDLGYNGSWYTWERGRTTANNVKERLDRCLATKTWRDLFPLQEVFHLTSSILDHNLTFITTNGRKRVRHGRRKMRFWFEAMWVKELEHNQIVGNVWEETENSTNEEELI
ncbi:hypothetical protein CRYUN_Cryun02cG0125700 [Craigia yunnanensis]